MTPEKIYSSENIAAESIIGHKPKTMGFLLNNERPDYRTNLNYDNNESDFVKRIVSACEVKTNSFSIGGNGETEKAFANIYVGYKCAEPNRIGVIMSETQPGWMSSEERGEQDKIFDKLVKDIASKYSFIIVDRK